MEVRWNMGNYFNYQRISTKEERGRQGYNRQEKSINRYAKEHSLEFLMTFKEDASGKSFENRKEWQKLEALLQTGDTIVFKDISRFTREYEAGYQKYMELMNKGVNLVFIDNSTISTDYIKSMMEIAEKQQNRIAQKALEDTIELLLLVELDRVEKEREIIVKRIKQGLEASDKKSGRPKGKLDKMTDELESDIKKYLTDRSIKQVDLMNKHGVSRNTLKKYIEIVKCERKNKLLCKL